MGPSLAAVGYADVDAQALRHRRVPTVWACGDAADLETIKSAIKNNVDRTRPGEVIENQRYRLHSVKSVR